MKTRIRCPCCETEFSPETAEKPRSVDQLRRFWALCKAAFNNWPETHVEQFATVNDCRHYLTMSAGWRDVIAQVPVMGMTAAKAAAMAAIVLRAVGRNARVVAHNGQLVIWGPRSIAFLNMPHMEFCALNDAVEAVIRQELNVTMDELLSMRDKPAETTDHA